MQESMGVQKELHQGTSLIKPGRQLELGAEDEPSWQSMPRLIRTVAETRELRLEATKASNRVEHLVI